jgi:hypothetical protein
MSSDDHDVVWDERPDGLVVQFPAAADGGDSASDWGMLLFISLLAVAFVGFLIEETEWGIVSILLCIATGAGLAVVWGNHIWAMRHPQTPSCFEPITMTVRDGTLQIRRAGYDGQWDTSWASDEVADIRLCPTADYRGFVLGMIPVVKWFAPAKCAMVRVSVMLRSGIVEDVPIRAPEGPWIEQVEEKLRRYLGLSDVEART